MRPSALVLHTEQRPYDVLHFLLTVLYCGSVGDVITIGISLWAWWRYLPAERECNPIIRFWLGAMIVCSVVQTVSRARVRSHLRAMSENKRLLREPQDMATSIRLILQCKSWKLCHNVGYVLYFWFCLGVLWMVKKACVPSRIYFLPLGLVVFVCIRHVVIKYSFDAIFPVDELQHRPINWRQHQRIRIMRPRLFSELDADSTTEECPICIDAFADNDEIRILPCAHVFHKTCVDKWFLRVNSCPLCIRDVGATYDLYLEQKGKNKKQFRVQRKEE
eukprot:GEMP01023487.1.p1 GENE.GEMP01023487.1~~GEMP01023487.1.p1  ORF type:complete len:276 (+),score=32.73 GEMP01023487.1:461-1288(+)